MYTHTYSWSQLSKDDPLAVLQETFFFRIVEDSFRKGVLIPTMLCAVCPNMFIGYSG